jgi:hypothetical protein
MNLYSSREGYKSSQLTTKKIKTDLLHWAPAFFFLTEPNVLQADKRQDSCNHQDKAQNNGIPPYCIITTTELAAKKRIDVLIHSASTLITGTIKKLVEFSSYFRVDSPLIAIKETQDHAFVDVMAGANEVWERVEASYHQLRTYN